MFKLLRSEAGQGLVFVIMVTVLLFFLTSVVTAMTIQTIHNSNEQEEYIKAYWAADAGIEKAVAAIRDNKALLNNIIYAPDGVSISVLASSFENTSFTVTAQKLSRDFGFSLTLTSQGAYGSAQKSLKCIADIYLMNDYLSGITVLPQTPASLILPENLIVQGDLLVKGSVEMPNNAQITGNIYASGNISGADPSILSGVSYINYEYLPSFPFLDSAYYQQSAAAHGHVYNFNQVFNSVHTVNGGYYYVNGDVSITGNYYGNGVLFSTGNIEITGDLTANHGNLTLICLGEVSIPANSHVEANIIAQSFLSVGSGATLQGMICVGALIAPDGFSLYKTNTVWEDALTMQIKMSDWQETRSVF